ncbi:MAG: hypothetical protein WDA47_03190 [Bacilli bacterium]
MLCPNCLDELEELAIDDAFAKINSFMAGAKFALSKLSEMIGDEVLSQIEVEIKMEKQKMIREAMENIGKQFGSD